MDETNNPETEQIEVLDRPKRKRKSEIAIANHQAVALPKIRRFHVSSLRGIAREMGSVYREMRRGQLPMEDGKVLQDSLLKMSKVVEVGLLEERIARLEKVADGNEP